MRKPMKITMIGQKGVPSRFGGIETHVTELSTRLVDAGHHVIAYARRWYSDKKEKRYNGIDIQYIPTIRTKHLDAIVHTALSLIHASLFVRPDIIHIHGVGPALLSWIPRILRPQATVIVTFHCIDRNHAKWNGFARLLLKWGEKAAVIFPHATITVSKTLQNYAAVEYGQETEYIPNGISPRRVATNDILLEPFALQSYRYIAMVSRLVPHKGAHTLIAAWQQAREKRPELFSQMKLAIIGGSAFTDSYIQSLHTQAQGDNSIVFTGYQHGDTLKALFAGANFMVHPSTSEGLPIAILEAMSYGKAVIGSDIPENMEVIKEYGVPFSTGSIDELADAIIELAEDPMMAASIGHEARAFVEDMYNWDDIADETIDIYKRHHAMHAGLIIVR